MSLGRDYYKFFIIFTGLRYDSLCLSYPNSSRLCGFIRQIRLFHSVHIYWIFNSDHFQYGNIFISQILLCWTCSMTWSSVMQKNLSFFQVWYQIVLQRLDVFGTIQMIVNLNQVSWTITFYISPKHSNSYPPNFIVSLLLLCKRRSFRFPECLLTNSSLIECCSIQISSQCKILFQAFSSHSSYLSDQLNLLSLNAFW